MDNKLQKYDWDGAPSSDGSVYKVEEVDAEIARLVGALEEIAKIEWESYDEETKAEIEDAQGIARTALSEYRGSGG
jgi:isocitrate lyase